MRARAYDDCMAYLCPIVLVRCRIVEAVGDRMGEGMSAKIMTKINRRLEVIARQRQMDKDVADLEQRKAEKRATREVADNAAKAEGVAKEGNVEVPAEGQGGVGGVGVEAAEDVVKDAVEKADEAEGPNV